MKVLVTGALGFVGSNLACHFAEKHNAEVIGVDNNHKKLGSQENSKLIINSGVTFDYCDIRNNDDVENIFNKYGPFDCIFNMAAQVAFKVSVERPRLDFEINALGTFNLLEALRLKSPKALFVFASTNQVYGELKNVPVEEHDTRFDFIDLKNGVSEDHNLDFLSPYGCSKGAADMYVQDYGRVYGLNTVVTRFGGIYGTNQYSYEDHGWISYITDQVRRDKAFNRFGHGKQVRDVLFIDDILDAMTKIYNQKSKLKKGLCINIGGGKENSLSVLELLNLLEELTGNSEKSIINPMRQADKLVVYLDISKARKEIDWIPKVGYKEGIKRLIDWQNKI